MKNNGWHLIRRTWINSCICKSNFYWAVLLCWLYYWYKNRFCLLLKLWIRCHVESRLFPATKMRNRTATEMQNVVFLFSFIKRLLFLLRRGLKKCLATGSDHGYNNINISKSWLTMPKRTVDNYRWSLWFSVDSDGIPCILYWQPCMLWYYEDWMNINHLLVHVKDQVELPYLAMFSTDLNVNFSSLFSMIMINHAHS